MATKDKIDMNRRRSVLKLLATGLVTVPSDAIARLPKSQEKYCDLSGSMSGITFPDNNVQSLSALDKEQSEFTHLFAEASKLERLNTLVVLEAGGQLVAESFTEKDIRTGVNIKSVSKSVVSALTGVALQRGVFDSVSQSIGELAPSLIPKAADEKVKSITIQNLLTMQTGLQRTSGRHYGAWVNSDNWVKYALSRRFVNEPGRRMLYSTGDWHVLGAILSELTGKSLLSLSREWLGGPLGIHFAPWTRDPQGRYMGGNEMSLSAIDLAKFGQLYLDAGGDVLPPDWVVESLIPRTRSPWSGDAYGYGWFIRDRSTPAYFYGRGYGGQFVFVLPSSKRVVVMISDWTRAAGGGTYTETLHDLVVKHVL